MESESVELKEIEKEIVKWNIFYRQQNFNSLSLFANLLILALGGNIFLRSRAMCNFLRAWTVFCTSATPPLRILPGWRAFFGARSRARCVFWSWSGMLRCLWSFLGFGPWSRSRSVFWSFFLVFRLYFKFIPWQWSSSARFFGGSTRRPSFSSLFVVWPPSRGAWLSDVRVALRISPTFFWVYTIFTIPFSTVFFALVLFTFFGSVSNPNIYKVGYLTILNNTRC